DDGVFLTDAMLAENFLLIWSATGDRRIIFLGTNLLMELLIVVIFLRLLDGKIIGYVNWLSFFFFQNPPFAWCAWLNILNKSKALSKAAGLETKAKRCLIKTTNLERVIKGSLRSF
ncbi:hypothetical protein NQ859_004563, partial [Salmonella enterica]|nr:hypothetical protein [Salmonella enterica]